MSPYTIPSLVSWLASIFTISYIIIKRFGDKVSRAFIWLLILCFIWSFSIYMMRISTNPEDCFFWTKIRYIPLLLLPAVLVYLISIFPIRKTIRRISITISLLLFVLVVFMPTTLILLFTDHIVKGVEMGPWGYHAVVGDCYFIFMFYFLVLMMYVIVDLIHDYISIENVMDKRQVFWLIVASISLLFIESLEATFKIINLYIIPLNDILLLPMIVSICYLAIKYRKPDVIQI